MEDHLLEIFGGHDTKKILDYSTSNLKDLNWCIDAQVELAKIPGFVRGKVKTNTEKFARDQNISIISLELMYLAKESLV